MKTGKLMISAAIFAFCASVANANTTSVDTGMWARKDLANGQLLYTAASETPSLAFVCTNEGKLSAIINIDGGDLFEKLAKGSSRVRTKTGILSIENRESTRDSWNYYPATKLAQPTKPSVSRKLYNAAVTGSDVKLDMSFVEDPSISPPALNDDFKAFATTCSATNNS